MLQHLTRQGDDYVLRIDPSLVEQAGLTEQTRLEITIAGSAIVVAPVPAQTSQATVPAPAVSRGEAKEADVLRRLAE